MVSALFGKGAVAFHMGKRIKRNGNSAIKIYLTKQYHKEVYHEIQ